MVEGRNGPLTSGEHGVPGLGDLEERWAEVDRRVRELVRERPLAAVFGALVTGYLVSRITSRL